MGDNCTLRLWICEVSVDHVRQIQQNLRGDGAAVDVADLIAFDVGDVQDLRDGVEEGLNTHVDGVVGCLGGGGA